MAQSDPYWTTHRSEILHVMMVDGCAIRVGRDAKVRAARVQRGEQQSLVAFPLSIDADTVGTFAYLSGVRACLLVQAREALVEVVILFVPSTLV